MWKHQQHIKKNEGDGKQINAIGDLEWPKVTRTGGDDEEFDLMSSSGQGCSEEDDLVTTSGTSSSSFSDSPVHVTPKGKLMQTCR